MHLLALFFLLPGAVLGLDGFVIWCARRSAAKQRPTDDNPMQTSSIMGQELDDIRHQEMLQAVRALATVPSEQHANLPLEACRQRCSRYLSIKTGRRITTHDTGYDQPIMELVFACRVAARGTEELEAVLGAKPDKLEALLRAIAEGKKITVVRKKAT